MIHPESSGQTSSPGETRPWTQFYDPGVPRTIDYPSIPIHGLLEQSAEMFPKRAATLFYGAALTFAELNTLSNRFATALVKLGVRKGDRVALLMPNCPQYVIAFNAVTKLGAIAVPTNPLYVEREVEFQLSDSGAETIVTLTKFYPTVASVRSRTHLKNIIVTNIKEYMPGLTRALFTMFKESKEGHRLAARSTTEFHLFQDMLKEAPSNRLDEKVEPEDVALFLYTGGTTGTSKGAVLTHRNLVANALQVSSWLGTADPGREILLAALPFFHVYGMTTAMNTSLATAATMILVPRFQPEEVLKRIVKHRPTLFPGVPTMYVALINYPGLSKYDITCIKSCISGGAALPVEVQTKFEALTGAKLVEGYGLTEASPVTHCNPLHGQRKIGSIGVPFPDTDARVVDLETGTRTLPPGEIGELAVKGPQVMRGYWNRPDETNLVRREGGWLLTGDMAKVDDEGYFTIVDRKKDLIIAGGYNIYPREIEEVLFEHPKVKEACAIGVPDPYRGETVKVFIVLKEGQSATQEDIMELCKERLARFKLPKMIEFRSDLPKSLVGKVLRRVLVEEERHKLVG